jgi:hypothetical protein
MTVGTVSIGWTCFIKSMSMSCCLPCFSTIMTDLAKFSYDEEIINTHRIRRYRDEF